jgi:hypothetical protein
MARALILALALAGCVSAPPRSERGLDVVGSAADRRQLAGTWRGTFETPDHTHDGTVEFTIDEDGSSGDGSVVLSGQKARLRVIYVRVSGSSIAGAIEPYYDNVCRCTVYSTFKGTLDPNGIRGEFQIKPRSGEPIIGTWNVAR